MITCSIGQSANQLHIDGDGSVLHRGIDSRHFAIGQAVVGIDRGRLADEDAARLGLGNLQLRLQLIRLHHLRQHGSDGYVLAHSQRQIGQHSGNACAHLERIQLLLFQVINSLRLRHLGLLHGEL